MGELAYLNTESKLHHAQKDPTLLAYCALQLFGEAESDLTPDLAKQLLYTPSEKIKHEVMRTYRLDYSEANAVFNGCFDSVINADIA